MKYNKLVRDKIPEIIKASGQTPVTHIAGDNEYWNKLLEKLGEEVEEFIKSEKVEELADIEEVLKAIRESKGIGADAIEKLRVEKEKNRGAFKKRIILEETT